jgi:molecular chaperone DnaJ
MDYYQTLEIPSTANEEEIKKAYRRLAMKFHPDRNPGDKSAAEIFKTIQEAYAILSDSSKKFDYDNRRAFYHETITPEEDREEGYVYKPRRDEFGGFSASRRYAGTKEELDAIQCQFFGVGGGQGSNILIHVMVSKDELAMGTTITARWKKRDKCKTCSGSGYNTLLKCSSCKGTGLWDMVIEEMMLEIPAGTPGGHQIVVRGRGEYVKDGISGNLHIVVLES